jgi:hypothetical protein
VKLVNVRLEVLLLLLGDLLLDLEYPLRPFLGLFFPDIPVTLLLLLLILLDDVEAEVDLDLTIKAL